MRIIIAIVVLAFLAPFAAQYGAPVVAPVTNTKLCLAINSPNFSEFSKAVSEQCPVSAAPETQILYFKWYTPLPWLWTLLSLISFSIFRL